MVLLPDLRSTNMRLPGMMATGAAGAGLGAVIVCADPMNWGFAATSSKTAVGTILRRSFGFEAGGNIAMVLAASSDDL